MIRQSGFPRARVPITAVLGLAACGAVAALIAILVARSSPSEPLPDWRAQNTTVESLPVDLERRVEAFCSDCHALPLPESFDRDRWHHEVKKGYEFYARTGRNDLDPPPPHQTVAYYRSRAPERVEYPRTPEAERPLKTSFRVARIALDDGVEIVPEIASLRWTQMSPQAEPVLLACDMRYGQITAVGFDGQQTNLQILARLANPCRVEPCDLDGDGVTDLVATDLGSYLPSDHDRGRVVVLRQRDGGVEIVEIASGLSRPADVRPADFDGDGDTDLVVAEFGWYSTGRILHLENRRTAEGQLQFLPRAVDQRPGVIHVPVHDFDGDGRPDFAALVSQEYESVEIFLNKGPAEFLGLPLWTGPDLTFGSSGLTLVDLDLDGDQDLLYSNGDAWDNAYASPHHGIQWLENRGGLEFTYHRLADMPGAYRALAGDVDGDGDQDIVASAWLPPDVQPRSLRVAEMPSLVCLEQTQAGVFVLHTLETGKPFYAAMELADFDGDGDLDLAVASGPHIAGARREPYWLSVWWNRLQP